MSVAEQIEIRRLAPADLDEQLDALADVLADCVAGGASVSYMAPFSHEDARSAFAGFAAEAEQGRRLVLAAFADGDLVGTVQVILDAAAEPAAPRRDRKAPRAPLGTRARHCPASHGARRGRGASGGQDAARAGHRDRRQRRAPLRAHGLEHGSA